MEAKLLLGIDIILLVGVTQPSDQQVDEQHLRGHHVEPEQRLADPRRRLLDGVERRLTESRPKGHAERREDRPASLVRFAVARAGGAACSCGSPRGRSVGPAGLPVGGEDGAPMWRLDGEKGDEGKAESERDDLHGSIRANYEWRSRAISGAFMVMNGTQE